MLTSLHEHGPLRQVGLSDALGLARTTGISLIDELTSLGLAVTLDAEPSGRRGRPSRVVAPCRDVVVVAIEIAVDTVRVDVVGLGGDVRSARDLPISPARLGPAATMAAVSRTVGTVVADVPNGVVVGMAVAIHGAVDRAGHIVFAPNLGWSGIHVGDSLRAHLAFDGLAVVIGNDADLGALGELRRGAGRGHADFLYLSAERGIGGGLVVNGQVVMGANGLAGEVGHMKIGAGAGRCGCGQRGCWEAEIGSRAIAKLAGVRSIDTVFERAGDGDVGSLAAVQEAAWRLGRGLGILIPLLQPSSVIINGHLAHVVRLAGPEIERAIATACPSALARAVDVRSGLLGPDAALIGAAELAFAPLLANPAAVTLHPVMNLTAR